MTLQSAFYPVTIVQSSLASPAKRSLLHPIRAQVEPSEKSVEIMRKFSEQYARRSGTYFCVDKTVTSVVIKGLADHKDSLGAPLCPCRHYDDKAAEVGQGFWNCPCVPMRESCDMEKCSWIHELHQSLDGFFCRRIAAKKNHTDLIWRFESSVDFFSRHCMDEIILK